MVVEFEQICVSDAMHSGILSCPANAPLSEIALTMARYRVHAVAITDPGTSHPWGAVSDMDVAAAIASGVEPSAGEMAATEPLVVSASDRLDRAAQLMTEHAVSHLVVLDSSQHPIGVISTLDLAAAYVSGRDEWSGIDE